jgi:serine/threonine-protein kinase
MGEVYRARDTILGREVAIKVLPAALAQHPDRLARFEREAKVLAALNHRNIAIIHGLEDHAIVMELVEGPTLADRVAEGALPLDESLRIAAQIADALEAAHEKGVVHRDLKPANIKVREDGTVKVLDFGLATAVQSNTAERSDGANSPTLTMGGTEVGVILGTASYMSPEQAAGKPVDRRADIWSFGVVLWEVLTGKRLFDGESVSHTLADVLRSEIDFGKLPRSTPSPIRELLKRCLDRDLKTRLQAVGEARIAIQKYLANPTSKPDITTGASSRSWLGWLAASVAMLIAVVLGFGWWRATRPVERPLQPLVRLDVNLGPDAVAGQFTTTTEISPDGSRLVFPAKSANGTQMLAARLLEENNPTLLSGTENGRDPFFSPDGKWIGFFADGEMKKISVQGGAPVVLCDAPDARGASWGLNGEIVVALRARGALSRVSAEGGTPQPVTKLETGTFTHRWPQTLPGSSAVLFTLSPTTSAFEEASIAAVSLKTGEVKILVRGAYFGRYVHASEATGHLAYVHEGVLFVAPFDLSRLELRGAAVPMLENLAGDPNSGAGQFSFSQTGSLVYRTGRVSAQSWPVSWLNKSGETRLMISKPDAYTAPRFSPNGQQLAITQIAGNDRRIFVYDWQRGTMSRLALNVERPGFPIWSPDGKHIVFRFSSASGYSLGWIRADGSGETQRLLDSKDVLVPYAFFPDGRRLAYYEVSPDSGDDLWTLPVDVGDADHPKPQKPEPFLHTQFNERYPAVSPDGGWIAYRSDETGRDEIYVQPFPGPGAKWQISSDGGTVPVWSRNGRELFFESPERRIVVVAYTAKADSFVPDKPKVWSDQQLHDVGGNPNYDLAPDGKQFAIFPELKAPTEEKGDVHVTFLLNFFDELRRRAPVTK